MGMPQKSASTKGIITSTIKWEKFAVFDAEAKYQSTPLSENLLKGPDPLKNLIGALLRFCQGKFCVMADIEKMFHQVMANQRNRASLRFIWRSNGERNFQDIQISLEKLTHLVKIVSRPEQAITDDFYMDDYLDSFHIIQEAIKVSNDVTNALSDGGFHLTKWVSNDQQILKALPSQEVSSTLINIDFDDVSIERAPGILWNPGADALQIRVTAKDVLLTKSGILSYTSSVFDPLGILAPTETDDSKSLETKI